MGGFANCAAVSTPTTSPPCVFSILANHEYDITDFWDAVNAHNVSAVGFLKARAIQDGHADYSNPLDEQIFLVNTVNALERTDEWKETAIIILYDDSDGWYDHVMGPIVNQSNVPMTSSSELVTVERRKQSTRTEQSKTGVADMVRPFW